MKQQLLLLLTFLFIQFQLSAQCGAGEQELFLTTSGGSFPNEKWVSITTGPDGGGTVIWAQGNGTYGNGSGLVTDESFCVTPGQTYYINCYDSYDDGWDGTTYAIRTGTGGSGTLIANNGGDSPNDGNNEDSTSSFEDPATELESSEAFSFTTAISVDCSGGGYTDDYCYENSTFEILEFQSSDGSALRITFNSGTVENTYDELIVYDSDGTTQLYNGYGSGGNVAGLSFTASGSTISFGVQADISVSCGSGSQTTINYTVSCVGCTPATVANEALSPNCPTDNSVTFDVTDMGSASSLTVTNDAGGVNPANITATGTAYTVTGLPADGSSVTITLTPDDDPACSVTIGPIALDNCPPANDDLCNAIALTLGASCTGDAYTNTSATTQTGEPSGSCFNGGAQNTVWFSFVAPASGEVTITTDIAPADLNDSEIALYGEGAGFDCTDLSTLSAQIACDQDGGSVVGFGYMSVIEATGLTGGETYYVQVSGYSNASGDFCIEVIEPCAIVSIVDAGTSTACNSSTNEYAQDVVVTYAAAPGSGTLDVTIDGITVNAPITGSPQTVTVSGLNADGASKDVSAAFSADGACSLNAVNVFVAPVACGCGITSITDAGTGVMDCVGATYDYEVVVAYENAPGSGTLELSAGTGSASVAITGSPQTVLITGLTADGNAVNVSASFSADPGCSATANALFTAPVVCPPANDNLCDAIALTLGASCTGDAYTNVGATTQAGEPSGSCFSGGAQNTVWFSFVAPASGEVTITTDIAPADLNDSEIALYGEGAGFDCTDLSTLSAQIACDQDGGSVVGFGYMSVIEATGLTGGETYYVQVSGYSNASGDFCIEVIEPCAIVSIVDAGTSTACNSSTNEYAQDVVVTYAAAPGSGTLDVTIDGITVNAPITGSPQTVTVSGLNADGASKDVSAAFSADGACSLNAVNVFVAPVACGCGITSITDAGTGVMDCVGATYDYEVVVAYENAPGSGTLELSAGTGSASVAITGSPQTVLITGLTADGNAVNVSASFSADPGCSATANALFTAPVACPPANDDCANAATLMVTEDGMCSNTAGTNLGATASGESPNPSCGSFGSGEDVWYEVTVPAIGELTIEMSSAGGPTDWTMQVYSGSCGSLSLVECDDDDGPGLFPSVTLSGRPEGEVLLVRVFEYGNNATGSFNICAFFTPECGTNSVVLETGMNIYELDEPCDAPNGWTYYSAPDVLGNYMFAIEWGDNNGAAKTAATVEITVDDMITAEDGSLAASYGMGRYWNVDIGGASLVDPVNVRFYYSPAEKAAVEAASAAFATLNGVPDNGFSWFKTDGTVFTPADITANNFDTEMVLLMEDATGTENGVTYVQFDGITSFSGGTGAAGAGAGFLPAELLSFSGESMSAGNKLAWATATEENVADFIIERSVDARGSWERLGKVAAAGNSSDIVEYSFMDDKPLSSAYYRLRIEDVDGSFAYSPIIQLQRARGEAEVLLYPIPTKDRLMVRFENAQGESVQTRIYDLAGRQLQTAITAGQEGSQTLQLDVQALDAGVFILEMELDGQVYRQRFVKQ